MNEQHRTTMRLSRKFIGLLFSLSLFLIFITYSNHFHNSFHFDDSHVIQSNFYIRDIKNIPEFFKDASLISSLPTNQQYRPMVATTLALEYAIDKNIDNTFWFHVSMFAWFIIQCVFLFFFLLKIANITRASPWNPLFALFGMTLYGVHTANAETINYVCARSDSMSTCWIIITLLTFIKWPTLRKFGLHFIPWIIACLFKQTSIVLPALLSLYVLFFEKNQGLDTLFKKDTAKQTWLALFKSTGATWIFSILLFIFLKNMDPSTYSPGGTSSFHYLITQPFVMVHYFLTFFLPLQLSADTDWGTLKSVVDDRFFVGIIFIISAFTIAFFASKKQQLRPIAFGLLWFFITLLPTSSVIPLAEVMNDHRLFFPLIGLTITFCYGLYHFILNQFQQITNKNAPLLQCIIAVLLLILGAFSYGTYQRNKVWHDEESLWKDVTLKSPLNGRGLMSYGLALMSIGRYDESKYYYKEAEKYVPTYPTLMINLGIVNRAMGLLEESDQYFEKAVQYSGGAPDVLNYYAQHYQARKPELAEQVYLKSLYMSPGNVDTRHQLMHFYWENKTWDKLKVIAQDTLKLVHDDRETLDYLHFAENKLDVVDAAIEKANLPITDENLVSLSTSFIQHQDYKNAIVAARKALSFNPKHAQAYNNICLSYNKLQAYEKAEIACEAALELEPNLQLAKMNLADSVIHSYQKDLTTLTEKAAKYRMAEIYIELSLQYYSNKDYPHVIEAAQEAIAIEPNHAIAYNNVCAAYNELQEYEKAEMACRKALEIDPNMQLAKNNLDASLRERQHG